MFQLILRFRNPMVVPVSLLAIAGSVSPLRAADPPSTTPIKHVVVIFQENVSFDHYFATYPMATNPPGEPAFHARAATPSVNGLNGPLLSNNPNAANPMRLDRSQAVTCDQDHNYADEQKAFNHGLMNKFVESASGGGCPDRNIVMNYFDGNTVTALWNYAQHFAMSDNRSARRSDLPRRGHSISSPARPTAPHLPRDRPLTTSPTDR